MATKYLHGFDKKEQARLLHQAKFLEPYIYGGIDLSDCQRLLEVGCGVGAQTQILLRRFPQLRITGVDLSAEQLGLAQVLLKRPLAAGTVELHRQDAQLLALESRDYDAAFLCWFLEHVPEPIRVLRKVRGHLRPGGRVICSEVFNQTLFVEPYSPAFIKYWFEFNDLQWSIKGHPFVGSQLGNLLKAAGFDDIAVEARPFHFDSRNARQRAEFTEYFYQILLSAAPTLVASGRVTKRDLQQMKKEVERVKRAKDAVFFYAYMRATARAPR
jgi:ubiquinone/menaquinone biosynthesis C-methylase UbiE